MRNNHIIEREASDTDTLDPWEEEAEEEGSGNSQTKQTWKSLPNLIKSNFVNIVFISNGLI